MFFSIRFSVRHTHLLYWLIGVVCHESQNGEDYHAAEDGGAAVAEGDQHAVLMAIALELAVRGQGNDAAAGRTQRKDHLLCKRQIAHGTHERSTGVLVRPE